MKKNYYPLKLSFDFMGESQSLFPTIIKDNNKFVMIDCGYPNFITIIEEALETLSLSLSNCSAIVITHHDYDHVGSLLDIIKKYQHIKVYSSKIQKPYIQGDKTSLRLEQAKSLYPFMPDDQKPFAKKMEEAFSNVNVTQVDYTIEDKKLLPWANGTEIIDTSGHMPGHISLYLREDKVLIAGDALIIENGILGIANPELCLDIKKTMESVEKLLEYDIEKIVCYHGGIIEENIKDQLKNILI